MALEELLKLIPEVLLYIIPGFLILKIIEVYTPTKKHEQYETILWSIVYSFIVGIEYSFLGGIIKSAFASATWSISISESKKLFLYFALAVLTGYLLVKLPKSCVGSWITKAFNANLNSAEDVWFDALHTKKGVWATVYLKNGLVYTGILSKFTADADEKDKLVLLKSYRLTKRNESADNVNNAIVNYFLVVSDYSTDSSARVLLRYEDIIAIEMHD